jgi:hypothetical protein
VKFLEEEVVTHFVGSPNTFRYRLGETTKTFRMLGSVIIFQVRTSRHKITDVTSVLLHTPIRFRDMDYRKTTQEHDRFYKSLHRIKFFITSETKNHDCVESCGSDPHSVLPSKHCTKLREYIKFYPIIIHCHLQFYAHMPNWKLIFPVISWYSCSGISCAHFRNSSINLMLPSNSIH